MEKYKILDLQEDNIKDEKYLRDLLITYELDDIAQNLDSYQNKELDIHYQIKCVKLALNGSVNDVIEALETNWLVPIKIIYD